MRGRRHLQYVIARTIGPWQSPQKKLVILSEVEGESKDLRMIVMEQ